MQNLVIEEKREKEGVEKMADWRGEWYITEDGEVPGVGHGEQSL